MSQLLDLRVEIAARPPEASPETAAPITLRCETLKLKQEEGMFLNPLTKNERNDLRWYLEEYWKWPFEGFAQRGSTVEQLLPVLGQRLYQAVFGQNVARDIIEQWRAETSGSHQISVITTDARTLSLPWELLHDGQEFLALQTNPPISIVRRIAEDQQPSSLVTTFEKPLRVLLVTARPVDEGQVDARIIAREVLDVMQDQIEAGTIELEFLRPPTFEELTGRLSNTKRPVHVLHFDGHGVFFQFPDSQGDNEERGWLYFEKGDGRGDRVAAVPLAEMLSYAGVQVAVLNACQSAVIGEKDIFSSVAVQLLQGGVQAVVAMSASVMTTSAALYVKAFYGALAAGSSVQAAHEQAQRALHEHPERNPFQRRLDEAGKPVNLQDWWLPYLYVQRSLALRPLREEPESQRSFSPPTTPRPKSTLSTYEFTGRSAELLQIERSLLRKRMVIISGFGGIGKTALAREVADWLIRTKMYDSTCFVSFEQGGDASALLSNLGNVLAINDGSYHAYDPPAALAILAPLLRKRRVLIIADSVESILPGGDEALDDAGRNQLWEVLAQLQSKGAGVLITSRSAKLDDQRFVLGTQADYQELKGLEPDDAYALAVQVLNVNRIDLAHIPYTDLRELLVQLDNHPLAIRLVLPALQSMPVAKVQADFASLLPTFQDDQATGRNRSLLASLDYSLRRLSEEQRELLPRLALFKGGTWEPALLKITEIPEITWAELLSALEQAALLTVEWVHEALAAPFLRFHPVLEPYLRRLPGADDAVLRERYIQHYFSLAVFLYGRDSRETQPVRALVRREFPNLQQALELSLRAGQLDMASGVAEIITLFLDALGLLRERDKLRQRMAEATATVGTQEGGPLTPAVWSREIDLGEDELQNGNWSAAYTRFKKLLERIEALPEGTPLGRGSYEHCQILHRLAVEEAGVQPVTAEQHLREALAIIDALIIQRLDEPTYIHQRGASLVELGKVLSVQGKYAQAQEAYEEALKIATQQGDRPLNAATLGQLGILARSQRNFAQAQSYLNEALSISQTLGQLEMEAESWSQLGEVARERDRLNEAARCYREALAINERLGDQAKAATICNELANVAHRAGRPTESESWLKRALELDKKRVNASGDAYARDLGNLAYILLSEIQVGHVTRERLTEARGYAEQALAILEKFGPSLPLLTTLRHLVQIADLEGRAEAAGEYRRRYRETFAASADNRSYTDQRFGRLIADIAAAARGDTPARARVEAALPRLEGEEGLHIAAVTRRIWDGERDATMLTTGLDEQDTALVYRVLENLVQSTDDQDRTTDKGAYSVVEVPSSQDAAGADLFLALLPSHLKHLAPHTARLALSQRVQGHPLSIQLLASRFAETTVDLATFLTNIEAELESAEKVAPTYLEASERQKTLYACMDYSVKRLTPEQRRALDTASLFQAPFRSEFAAYVLNDEEQTSVHLQTLVRLGLLNSTVKTFKEGELILLDLHPMVRWYIQHHLSGMETVLLERYGQVYERLARQTFQPEGGYDQSSLVRYLVRQILPDFEAALKYLPATDRSSLAYYLAGLYQRLGQNRSAEALFKQALKIGQRLGHIQGVAATQQAMAGVLAQLGRLQEALSLSEQALRTQQELGDLQGVAMTQQVMAGVLAQLGKPQDALRLYEQALSLIKEVGNRAGEATTLSNMAWVYQEIGKPQDALRLYKQALPTQREVGDRAGEAVTLNNMAWVYQEIGKPQDALRLYEQALSIIKEVGNRADEAATLVNMAVLLYQDGQRPQEAIANLEQALVILRASGLPQDGAGRTPEMIERALLTMRDGTF